MKKLYEVVVDVPALYVVADDEVDAEDFAEQAMRHGNEQPSFSAYEIGKQQLEAIIRRKETAYTPYGDAIDDKPEHADLSLPEIAAFLLETTIAAAEAKALFDANLKLFPDVDPKPILEDEDDDGE